MCYQNEISAKEKAIADKNEKDIESVCDAKAEQLSAAYVQATSNLFGSGPFKLIELDSTFGISLKKSIIDLERELADFLEKPAFSKARDAMKVKNIN